MPVFEPVGEKEVTRAIVDTFLKQFHEYTESDIIIIGAGPSGLMAARDIAAAGRKVLLVERNNYLGGGFWRAAYLFLRLDDPVLTVLGGSFRDLLDDSAFAGGPIRTWSFDSRATSGVSISSPQARIRVERCSGDGRT